MFKNLSLFLSCVFLVLVSMQLLSCSNSSSSENSFRRVIDIKSVSNKSESEVKKLLGDGQIQKPWSDKKAGCASCPRISYKGDSVEVIFVNGKSDRITVNNIPYPLQPEAVLASLGLQEAQASFSNEGLIRWNNVPGFHEITASGNERQIDYILIQTKTE